MDDHRPEEQRITDAGLSGTGERREVLERLRLHEERATVEVVPEAAGAVTIRRVVTERQENVPITLRSEHLEITVRDNTGGRATLNGEELEVGRVYEVALYEERALIDKQVYALADVTVAKEARTYTQTQEITLRREELAVDDPQGLVRDRTMPSPIDPDPTL
ncbi:YsnF/AvaK domain-containing protein [Deinococcus sp. MIMF12]|uniref:YsnF/AvaK domain-containing protein n=1 Tax=Deinococcus rhizophilus TaxID=3049544 RepID=A0ABT7JDJ8_9DEIO|nr:YsnF/AvaK domain-containing protein [Deinococcus rhizophilus]MDL2343134.1 YsnF/AvaK domain-containing protein [Deinococcus rhizophilus]